MAASRTGSNTGARRLRVVVAKVGLDGHDRGAKVIARILRDAGIEVIYTGLHQEPEQVVATALQEDADAIGLSILSGAHSELVHEVMQLLQAYGLGETAVAVGGTIPRADEQELLRLGVARVFRPGSTAEEIRGFFLELRRPAVLADRAAR